LAGVSLAEPITFNYENPDGSVGASVYLWTEMSGDLYKYTYQVENKDFDPDGLGADSGIFVFLLPITKPLEEYAAMADTGEVPVGLSLASADGVDYLQVDFLGDAGLVGPTMEPLLIDAGYIAGPSGISDKFYIVSKFGPEFGNAVLTDGESANILVLSNLDVDGGGNDTNPVPEPATLLLLGMGALGLEGFRRLKSRRA
jgi:hypothetical protein